MAETKFTPGPWSIFGPLSDKHEPAYRVSAERTLSLTVSPCPDGFVHGENKANAHLIAAAPELYEALEEIVENAVVYYEGSMDIYSEAIENARNALAKARGEENGQG